MRVGASKHGEPYQYSVTYDDSGEYAVIKGFYHKNVTHEDFELIVKTINEASGKLVAYERIGRALIVQKDLDTTKGKIVMSVHKSKSTIQSPVVAQKDNKKIDLKVLLAGSQQAAKMFQTGKETMLNVERVVLADGSVIDMFHHIRTAAL